MSALREKRIKGTFDIILTTHKVRLFFLRSLARSSIFIPFLLRLLLSINKLLEIISCRLLWSFFFVSTASKNGITWQNDRDVHSQNYLCTADCMKQIFHEMQILTSNFIISRLHFSSTMIFFCLQTVRKIYKSRCLRRFFLDFSQHLSSVAVGLFMFNDSPVDLNYPEKKNFDKLLLFL